MKRLFCVLLALSTALVSDGGLVASGDRALSGAGGGAPDRRGAAAAGHAKPLPPFVEKHRKERIAAADLVARGLVAPDANGTVTLRNGRFVNYKLQGTEYLTAVLIDFTDVPARPDPGARSIGRQQHLLARRCQPGALQRHALHAGRRFIRASVDARLLSGAIVRSIHVDGPGVVLGAGERHRSRLRWKSPEAGAGGDDANGPVYRVVDAALKALAASGNYGGLDLAKADQIDRYDCDGDGIFAEPDGYIDHFGLVHAGAGEEAGGGAQGGNAIWSHSWYANVDDDSGPVGCLLGGYNLPGTNLWVGDYTIQPEDGGVGVFAHEFGHDLGLPDLYDTAGGPDNGTGYWTLMSSGSWASDSPDAIGDHPVHMGGWEKLALGWLGDNLARVALGANATVELGPAEGATRGRYQALRVDLPEHLENAHPVSRGRQRPELLLLGAGRQSRQPDDEILRRRRGDADFLPRDVGHRDRLGLRVSRGSGERRVADGPDERVPDHQPERPELRVWHQRRDAQLDHGDRHAARRDHVRIGFRYWTDAFVARPGFAVDSISVGGVVDNATTTTGWTLAGFQQLTNGQFTQTFFHYYLAESRSYQRNDTSLCGAYNFLFGNWLEKQCYAAGLLIWYRNSSVPDNNTSQHPGSGQILPIDSHPRGQRHAGREVRYWSARWQTWDATFGVDTNAVTLSQVDQGGAARRRRPTPRHRSPHSTTRRRRRTTTPRFRTTRSRPPARA